MILKIRAMVCTWNSRSCFFPLLLHVPKGRITQTCDSKKGREEEEVAEVNWHEQKSRVPKNEREGGGTGGPPESLQSFFFFAAVIPQWLHRRRGGEKVGADEIYMRGKRRRARLKKSRLFGTERGCPGGGIGGGGCCPLTEG